ncbi:MAG: hypothetical protein ACK4PR_05370 [Gammaproteobacteria bacterium]
MLNNGNTNEQNINNEIVPMINGADTSWQHLDTQRTILVVGSGTLSSLIGIFSGYSLGKAVNSVIVGCSVAGCVLICTLFLCSIMLCRILNPATRREPCMPTGDVNIDVPFI